MRFFLLMILCALLMPGTMAADTNDKFRIVRLNISPIKIGDKDLKIGGTFSKPEEIKWSSSKQHLEAKEISTGKLYHFSEKIFKSRGLKSLKDYFVSTSRASTRDPLTGGGV